MENTIQEENSDTTVIQEVDRLFDHGDPPPSEMAKPIKKLEEKATPLQKKIKEFEARMKDPDLTDLDKGLLEIEMKELEAQMIPYTARIDRIRDYIADRKRKQNLKLDLARAEVEYGVRSRVEKDREPLRSKVVTLADRTRNGLSPNAAPQTRSTYLPVEETFNSLLQTTDEDQVRKLAEDVIGELKPILLQKISGFEDIKTEMLAAFVETAKK